MVAARRRESSGQKSSMPIHRGKDAQGSYYQWGDHGKRYYYVVGDADSREDAKVRAGVQARAAYSHGYHSS